MGKFLVSMLIFMQLLQAAAPLEARKPVRRRAGYRQGVMQLSKRIPSKERIDRFRSDSDFDYNREIQPHLSWWDIVKLWLFQKFIRLLSMGDEIYLWDILLYSITAIALAFAVSKILRSNIRGLFARSRKAAPDVMEDLLEDINAVDYESQLKELLRARQYRFAVRLLYRKLLKELSDREMISWKKEKTNRDYAAELGRSPVKNDFVELTRIYEFIWYGNFMLEENDFKKIADAFYRVDRLLQD